MVVSRFPGVLLAWIAVYSVVLLATRLPAQQDSGTADAPEKSGAAAKSDLIRLAEDSKVWIDLKRKIVVVDGKVALREGQLIELIRPEEEDLFR